MSRVKIMATCVTILGIATIFAVVAPATSGSSPQGSCLTHPGQPRCSTTTRGSTTTIQATTTTQPPSGWTNVVNDQFAAAGIPNHWHPYLATWVSAGHVPTAYYSPNHCTVPGDGYLYMLLAYEPNGVPGNPAAAWYSCTMNLTLGLETSPDVRVTLRWRLVPTNGGVSEVNMPLRWPNSGCWPADGEEDWWGGHNQTAFYSHWSTTGSCSGGGHQQIYYVYADAIDSTQWHTYQLQRRTVGTNVIVDTSIDGTPVWHCDQNGGAAGGAMACNTTTMPPTLKHTVLQQEVPFGGITNPTNATVTYQVDWITVDNPS